MNRFSRIARVVAFGALLLPLAAAAKANPFTADSFVLNPPASAAPAGSWRYAQSYGYLWVPDSAFSMAEAEWAPWDPWWAMPYGRWVWADSIGWGWTPAIPAWSTSPLGWGWDGWYGGWYGFLPNGWPAGTLCSYGTTLYDDTLRAQAWVNRHQHREPHGPGRVKVVAVVAAPPPGMALIPPMREPRDRGEAGLTGRPAGFEVHPGANRRAGRGQTGPAHKGQNPAGGNGGGGQIGRGTGPANHLPSGNGGGGTGFSLGSGSGGGGQGKPHH